MSDASSLIQIRMLGSLVVHRPDGTEVDPGAWRTGKTADLLRILALSNNRYVSRRSLTEKLWPDSPPERARASLRTAASGIRRAIGFDCLGCQLGGIALQGAWTDIESFLDLAHSASAATSGGEHEKAVQHTRVAEYLYNGDFHAHDDDSDWANQTRRTLSHARLLMLSDAASSCLAMGHFREAIHYADQVIEIDRCAEHPYRVRMQAYAELGEIDHALRSFETYRELLAEELGADPSPMTQDLHLRLLRGDRNPSRSSQSFPLSG